MGAPAEPGLVLPMACVALGSNVLTGHISTVASRLILFIP
jgi:hypothetical protein